MDIKWALLFTKILILSLTDGEDYTADPRTLTFSPGMSRVCFNVTILDDDRYELNEDLFVNITTSDPQTDINPMSAIVTIEDDEGKCIRKNVMHLLWGQMNLMLSYVEGRYSLVCL